MPVIIDNVDWRKTGNGCWGGKELIPINIDDPVKVDSTFQKYEGRWIRYQVTTDIKRQNEQVTEYHIDYDEEANKRLFREGEIEPEDFKSFGWGTHILILNRNQDSGKSCWCGEEGPGWRLEKLIGEKRRITVTKLQRAKDDFRKELLEFCRCCALTRETCQEALEAAHIIPVKCGGQETLGNGILLRADLHRLYDRGKFFINSETGKPERIASDGLSETYRKILRQGRLPELTLERVREALHKVAGMSRRDEGG